MNDNSDALERRLQAYLAVYDRQASATTMRAVRRSADKWEGTRGRRIRVLQFGAVVAFTTAVFVIVAVAFATGRPSATNRVAGSTAGQHTTTPTATPAATTCATLAHAADFDLFSIAPDFSGAPVSCQVAIATAEAACPPARSVCAGIAPQHADLSLLSGFGTVAYPPQFNGYRNAPVWMLSWPLDCSIAGPSMPGPKLGMVDQMPPTTSNGCSYVEFVSATSREWLFSVATHSCYPWVGSGNGAECQSSKN